MILGTAGHIDHGKTSLVEALTGIQTDRLKEEKARGITIELGFAHLDIDKRRIGVVDVPGHEKFVRHMVAGAGGIDVVMMVVAADEGIMPQTREHLAICQLMGIQHGFVALTKSDLVDEEFLEMVQEDVADNLGGTFLEGQPIVPCSVHDPASIAAIKSAIRKQLERSQLERSHRSRLHVPRLPIDRVFVVHGFGTVVTGTLLGGTFGVGDDVSLMPEGIRGRVRSLQIHGEEVRGVQPGSRVAMNLANISRDDVHRGQVVAPPGVLHATDCFDVEMTVLRHMVEGLSDRSAFILHTLTQRVPVRAIVLEGDTIRAGQGGWVQLRTEEKVSVVAGDRFVLRGFATRGAYGQTVAGGRILDPLAPRFRQRQAAVHLERLRGLASADVAQAVVARVQSAGLTGMTLEDVVVSVPFPRKHTQEACSNLVESGELMEQEVLVAASQVIAAGDAIRRTLDRYHKAHPDEVGASKEHVRGSLETAPTPRMYDLVLQRLERDKRVVRDGEFLRAFNFAPPRDDALDTAVMNAYRAAGLAGFAVEKLLPELERPISALRASVRRLIAAKQLERIKPDFLAPTEEVQRLRTRLQQHFGSHDTLSIPELREAVGLSRKHLVPLVEFLDQRGWTRRDGDVRRVGPALSAGQ